jgi:plastocyanin
LTLLSACGGSSTDDSPTPFLPANRPSPTHGGPVLYLSAQDRQFDKNKISADANKELSIIVVNNDAAPHNVAIYTNEQAEEEIFVGETFSGPGEVREYYFVAPDEGDYFFRCDVHPTTMTGQFQVD